MYWFCFEDGYRVCVKGFSASELKKQVIKHGKFLGKTRA